MYGGWPHPGITNTNKVGEQATPPATPPVASVEATLWGLIRSYDELRREYRGGRMEPTEYEAALAALVRDAAKAAARSRQSN